VLTSAILTLTLHDCHLVHGDLTGDNLFILPNGTYKLIDWARPFRGPADLDLAALLESVGHDPLEWADGSIVTMLYMLRIHWLAQCATRWFPAGIATYDQQIADLMAQISHITNLSEL
jgi:thiamine kinase-like enzyme